MKMMNVNREYCGKRYGAAHSLVGFAAGAAVGTFIAEVIYGTILVDAVFAIIFGALGSRVIINVLLERRKREFANEFCDYLDSIGGSLSCGRNAYQSFVVANEDMHDLYSEDAPICYASTLIVKRMSEGSSPEDAFMEMSEYTDSEEVRIFWSVYEVCNEVGGNLKLVVSDVKNVLLEKLIIEAEIRTSLTEPRNELNIMSVMPIIISMSLRMFGNNMTGSNMFFINTIALAIFAGSYVMGRKIVNIQV